MSEPSRRCVHGLHGHVGGHAAGTRAGQKHSTDDDGGGIGDRGGGRGGLRFASQTRAMFERSSSLHHLVNAVLMELTS